MKHWTDSKYSYCSSVTFKTESFATGIGKLEKKRHQGTADVVFYICSKFKLERYFYMNTQKPMLWKDLLREIENAHKIYSNW